jgi:hypothetical protein
MTVTLATIDLGEVCSLIIKVRDPRTDQLANATVAVTALRPTGGNLPATVTQIRTGVYEALWTPDVEGVWRVEVNVSGARAAIEYGLIRVRPVPAVT